MKTTNDFCQNTFSNPSKENNLIYTWIWNEPITKEIIDTQLYEFAKAGIKGIYILPMPKEFRPATMKTSMTPEYLSDEFFECVKYALNKGHELDMELWLYDEAGWPSGGACGKTVSQMPKARETVISKRMVMLKENDTYTASFGTIASFIGKKRITDGYICDSNVEVNEYYTEKASSAHPNSVNRVDCTNKDVIDTFINNTYERYKEALGDTFDKTTAIFTDEPNVIPKIIPENFFEVFYNKYGYDIKDYLYCIEDSSLAQTHEECMARIDYGRLIGELFYTNYSKNLGDWCRNNSKLFAGHLDLDHIPDGGAIQGYFSHLHALSEFDIPGIDVIWHQIRIPEENIPSVIEGAPFFPRIASSAAHQKGTDLALTESFAVYGDVVTPDEFRYVLNYQAIRGINIFNIMLTASGYSRTSSLVERPVFSPRKPGFYNLEHLSTYYQRLSYLLKLGEPQIDTALYMPCADFWANEEKSKETAENYIKEGNLLENKHIEFDIIDDYAISGAKTTENGLKVGAMTYSKIIVPKCEFMPNEIRNKITPYIANNEDINKVSNIRTMKRKTKSGVLYFIYNEGQNKESYRLEESMDTPLYKLDIASGEIYKITNYDITLNCGDMAVYYSTNAKLETVSQKAEYSIKIKDFEIIDIKQFVITPDGISMEQVSHYTNINKVFSGEVTYKARYQLPNIPQADERYKITLENTSVSARIIIDGKQIATVGITPMEAIIKGCNLRKEGVIEITVANTSGNEIVAKKDYFASLPNEIVGPYHAKCITFEEFAPQLKFGTVKISKFQ